MWTPEAIIAACALALTTLGSAFSLGLYLRNLVAKNERAENKRHRQNLARFQWICVALVRLGYTNGEMPTFDD
jgi:hypothetical protein